MIRLFFAVFSLVFIPNLVLALCAGQDIRPSLTVSERIDMDRRIAATPYAEGLYWVAKHGGQELHIIGTLHIPDPRLDAIAEHLAPVINRANRLYVEAGPAEESQLKARLADEPGLLFILSGPTLPDLLPPDLWTQVSEAAAARGYPSMFAAKMKPWFLATQLGLAPCMIGQMNAGGLGLDKMLIKQAEVTQVPVQALEPYDTLFAIMGADSLEEQIEMLKLGVLSEEDIANGMATLVDSYFDETPVEGVEMSRILGHRAGSVPREELDAIFDGFMDELLDRRNLAWMDILTSVPDGVSVAAFGAGHLSGEQGVLNLLEQAGFQLERKSLQ